MIKSLPNLLQITKIPVDGSPVEFETKILQTFSIHVTSKNSVVDKARMVTNSNRYFDKISTAPIRYAYAELLILKNLHSHLGIHPLASQKEHQNSAAQWGEIKLKNHT